MRTLSASLALLCLPGLLSCDSFQGSLVAMTVAWPINVPVCVPPAMPPTCVMQAAPRPILPTADQHIEMWVTTESAGRQRVLADVGGSGGGDFSGFTVVPAIAPDDACMIRAMDRDDPICKDAFSDDNLLYCGTSLLSMTAHQPAQGNAAQAALDQQQLVQQVKKVTFTGTPFTVVDSMTFGGAATPLLALVQWNRQNSMQAQATDPRNSATPDIRVTIPTAGLNLDQQRFLAQTRISECRKYRDSGVGLTETGSIEVRPRPAFYVGNPHQLTKPLSGIMFGVLNYQTGPNTTSPMLPSQNFNGITFTLPYSAEGITELLWTLEDSPYPTAPSPTKQLMRAVPDPTFTGRGATRMLITANAGFATGTINFPASPQFLIGSVSILTNLDQRLD